MLTEISQSVKDKYHMISLKEEYDEQNKLMNKIELAAQNQNRLTGVRRKEGAGDCLKEGEGISQIIYMKDRPMDTDNGVRIDYGSGGLTGWRWAKGEDWDICNSINNNLKV